MTKKEAINKWVIPAIRSTWKEEKCEEIIEALEQEPCIQEKQANADKIDAVYIDGFKAGYSQARFDLGQETCDDCISREDALARLRADTSFICTGDKLQAIEIVNNMPPVTPQPKTGHWILRGDINGQYQCDECGMFSGLDKFDVEEAGWKLSNFCSNCGAKMVESQESKEGK